MAANLSQAFLDGPGLVPSLVQELAAGNFHDGRESFHEYIYSKLIHGEDKDNNSPNIAKPTAAVFPNTELASSYSNTLAVPNNPYIHGSNNGSQPSDSEESKALKNQSLIKSLTNQKSESNNKQLPQAQAGAALHAGTGNSESPTKRKKKSYHKKEKSHVCEVCGRGFAEKYTLTRHMLTHTHVKPYSCSKCNMSFSRSDGLAKHMASGHRRVDAHHCDVCGGTFNSELSFEQHRREYGNTLPFVCNLCMLAFSQCCHLNYHMKSHSLSKLNDSFSYDGLDDKNNAIDVSELIPEDFSPPKKEQTRIPTTDIMDSFNKTGKGHHYLDMLDPNVIIKPEIEEFPTCGATLKQLSEDSSRRSGIGPGSFNAVNNFSIPTSTASHDLVNSLGNQADTTSVAAASYLPDTTKSTNVTGTNNSLLISESDMKKYYDIKIPNPKFVPNSDLVVVSVGEDGLFRCEICGKGFSRKYHMQRHVKLHTRGPVPRAHLLDWTRRPYACGVCKMGFTRQHHLTRHILIHTGERPHSCHICGRAFRRFTNLSLHIRTVHGAERPFKCHVCGRGFPRLYSLQRHLKLHARNAYALNSEGGGGDQLYKGFKAVGTVNVETRKSPVYTSTNPSNIQQAQGNGPESVSTDRGGNNEEYKPESNTPADGPGCREPEDNNSPIINQESYAFLQVGSHIAFQALKEQHKDQIRICHSVQTEDRQAQIGLTQQQTLPPPESENRAQQNRRISTDIESINLQNSVHPRSSGDFSSSPHHGEAVRSHISSLQSRNLTDFNPQQSLPNTNEERLISAGSLTSQNLTLLNLSASGNFHDLGHTDSGSYSQNQRDDGGDGFSVLQQQVQSPLPMMSMLERPGSHSMMIQTGCHDTYHHSSAGYSQSPSLQIQHHTTMNLSTANKSPANLQVHGGYSHNTHIDIRASQTGVSDPNVYSHSHNVNSLPFQVGSHEMYQQLLSESLNEIDPHPHPSVSPVHVTSHKNMQY